MGETMRWADGFIAVDWGTTNRRGYLIGRDGACTREFEDAKGILAVPADGFPAAIAEIRAELGDLPLLLAGMVGSNRGWVEAPYVAAPADLSGLVKGLVWPGEREALVPGVSFEHGNRADVMRGEEVQILGAVAAGLIDRTALVCHPGTHNKWALVRNGQIRSFRTVMTGELFSLLKDHSILSPMLGGKIEPNEAFREGAEQGIDNADLPAELFNVRARVLLGKLDAADAAAFTSGLLIGTDVRIGLDEPLAAQVVIMGRPDLTALYATAISISGRDSFQLDGERCFLAGSAKIAEMIT